MRPSDTRRMRQSTQVSWDICPRRAQYSMQPHPYTTSVAAARGTAYHAGLELYYRGVMENEAVSLGDVTLAAWTALEAEVERAEDRFKWDGESIESTQQTVGRMLEAYFTGGHAWDPTEYEVLGVEVEFTLPWLNRDLLAPWSRGWEMHGTIDLILRHYGLGLITPVDHKTAGRAWPKDKNTLRKLPQAAWYSLALEQMGHTVGAFFFDVMTVGTKKKGPTLQRVPVNLGEKDTYLQRFIETARQMDILDAAGLPWPANPSAVLCSEKYCDHWTTCPYGGKEKE